MKKLNPKELNVRLFKDGVRLATMPSYMVNEDIFDYIADTVVMDNKAYYDIDDFNSAHTQLEIAASMKQEDDKTEPVDNPADDFDNMHWNTDDKGTDSNKDHVNPSHYKKFMGELQWMETMARINKWKGPKFETAILLQIQKYLARLGEKDDEVQELNKALWYLKFLIVYKKLKGKPFLVRDIESLLKEKN